MIRIVPGSILLALLPWMSFGQASSEEHYCREKVFGEVAKANNPTCFGGKPIQPGKGMVFPQSNSPLKSASVARTPAAAMALHDWQFSYPAPAALISINVGSLLQSPMWASLVSSLGTGTPGVSLAALEKARSALNGMAQILMSISPNGAKNPSVLMLARGDIDGAASSWLRSSPGMQTKRLDAITVLAGDPQLLEWAARRMQSAAPQKTLNPLQQAATREALKYDAWIGVDPRQLASMASALGSGSNPALGMMASLRGVSLGLYLRDQLRLEALLETPSSGMAEQLLATYRQAESRRKQGNDPFDGQMWAAVEGASLRFTAIADLSHLKNAMGIDPAVAKMMAPQIAALLQVFGGPKPQSASAPPPTVTPGKIVIQGLDGGPREIAVK